jgi:hypothetical protein
VKQISVLLILLCSLEVSARVYGPSGCGVGSKLFRNKRGKVWNVLAVAGNHLLSSNQTFGMTSGTSGCDVHKKTPVAQIQFIESNKVALANDIARGKGEYISSLAYLYDCDDKKMGFVLKTHYDEIFNQDNLSSKNINNNIQNVIIRKRACL